MSESTSHPTHEEFPDYKKPPYDREVNAPAIIKLMSGLLLIAAASFVGMWWMYVAMKNTEISHDAKPHPFAEQLQNWEPPAPRLQFFPPTADIERLRVEEETTLTTYQGGGAGADGAPQYRIPVDRAIELLSERGLPGQGNVEQVSEELFGDTATAATSAQVADPTDEPTAEPQGGHEP